MSYLLDTNVISELVRPRPDQAVLSWLDNTPNEVLYLSVLTLGGIRKGVERLPDAPRHATPRHATPRLWLEHDLRDWFGARILPVDAAVDGCSPKRDALCPASTACWPPRRCITNYGWSAAIQRILFTPGWK